MNEKQKEQLCNLYGIDVDDNGYLFLSFKREGNILKAENEDYSLDLDTFKTRSRRQWSIFSDICEMIMKDTYPNHKFDYENAAAHNRKIVFSYLINERQYAMEITINPTGVLDL